MRWNRCLSAAALAAALFVSTGVARAADPAVVEAERKRVEVVDKISPSVVAIFAAGGGGGGSGVVITPDGYALTNFHVTSGSGDFMKCGLNDGKLYDAVIVGIDPTGDVAVIKLLGRDDFPHAELGDSDKVRVGDWAYAVGNPFLLATDFRPTVTYGIVSGVHRYQYPAGTFLEYTDCIQVDSSINPGNSGGPLFNDDGQVIGINGRGSFEKRGRVNSGAGYAISINQIKHFMDHLRSGRVVDHATLGATVTTDGDGAVVVRSILEESEAFRRGLRVGDEIVSFAGRPIRSVNQFKNILGIYPKGWKLPLSYRREGRTYEAVVRLRALHNKSEMVPGEQEEGPQPPEKPGEQPKPGDAPKDGQEPPKPGDQPGPGGRPKLPIPGLGKKEEPQLPEKYKHMFVKRPGYANYFFNEQEQQRLVRSLQDLGDYSKAGGAWTLSGTSVKDRQPFTATLGDAQVELKLGDRTFTQPLGGADIEELPPDSGGLTAALHHLRLFLAGHGDPFTEFYYLGSEPLDGTGEPADVLVASLTGVESRWYFSKGTGALLGFDTLLSEDEDECEIRFDGWLDAEGRRLPKTLQVRSGPRDVATLTIEKAELGAGTIKKAEPKKDEAGEKETDEKPETKDEKAAE